MTEPTAASDAGLEKVHRSLYLWAFCDIKAAMVRAMAIARCEVPDPYRSDEHGKGGQRDARLAFIGAAAWLDTVALLAYRPEPDPEPAGKCKRKPVGKLATVAWVTTYLKPWADEAEALYLDLRCSLLHNYATRNVRRRKNEGGDGFGLTHDEPHKHHKPETQEDGRVVMVIDVECFVGELDDAWQDFWDDCRDDPLLADHVVTKGATLLSYFAAATESAPDE